MHWTRASALSLGFTLASLAQQSAPAPAAGFVPSDELNGALPKWIRFSGEYRARLEGFNGGGFIAGNDDAYLLNRFRLNMRLQPASWLKLNFQGQDARVFFRKLKPYGPPFQDSMDLRMAFAEIGDPEKGSFSARFGRQELVFGEQRLVGHVSWLNTARTFDALRVTMRHKGYRLDAFASAVVQPRDGEFNRYNENNKFHGLYGGIEKLVPNAVIEPYAFWRLSRGFRSELGTPAKLDGKTLGVRMAGKLNPVFDYGTEMALQTGGVGSDDVSAWAGHWRVGYTVAKLRYKPRFIAEYNYATGDSNPRDGKRQTFDVLFPTPHDKYGLADQVGWKNIHHLRLGPEWKPRPKWLLSANYHSWWLASRTDALYNAGGAPIARVVGGARESHVGQEMDFQANYVLNKQIAVGGGYAHIFPGGFLKQATPGKQYTFPYLMLGYAF